ncbi:basic salivary proline-rich protein 2-like [Haemorhous mexicanus]|uniref:basic salivary proline-rich protein 2-like n=1 Tax=Haemorhous mexicanus TaxID=30427 RepID=UPI0028BDE597|nr:basic salivary proline-rich protein 2-like [Haemorhous mexicanus]
MRSGITRKWRRKSGGLFIQIRKYEQRLPPAPPPRLQGPPRLPLRSGCSLTPLVPPHGRAPRRSQRRVRSARRLPAARGPDPDPDWQPPLPIPLLPPHRLRAAAPRGAPRPSPGRACEQPLSGGAGLWAHPGAERARSGLHWSLQKKKKKQQPTQKENQTKTNPKPTKIPHTHKQKKKKKKKGKKKEKKRQKALSEELHGARFNSGSAPASAARGALGEKANFHFHAASSPPPQAVTDRKIPDGRYKTPSFWAQKA